METNRRDFLKKSAVAGGLVWAAPAVYQVAGAQTAGTPGPCDCPACQATGTGLYALGLTVGVANGAGCTCLVDIDLGLGQLGGAKSQTVCGKADNATCSASALVEGLQVRLATNVLLKASLLSSCVSCGSGSSQVLDLKLVVTLNAGLLPGVLDNFVDIDVPLTVGAGCNSTVAIPASLDPAALSAQLSALGVNLTLLAGLSATLNATLAGLPAVVTIVANEQACSNGTLTVNALHVIVLGLHVIAAQAKAGASGCACNACDEDPDCAPPTTRLC